MGVMWLLVDCRSCESTSAAISLYLWFCALRRFSGMWGAGIVFAPVALRLFPDFYTAWVFLSGAVHMQVSECVEMISAPSYPRACSDERVTL